MSEIMVGSRDAPLSNTLSNNPSFQYEDTGILNNAEQRWEFTKENKKTRTRPKKRPRKQEKKERKHALDQESDQGKGKLSFFFRQTDKVIFRGHLKIIKYKSKFQSFN